MRGAKATGFTPVFQKAKAAGAGCVYLSGVAGTNAAQLLTDKVAVVGTNDRVPGRAARGNRR